MIAFASLNKHLSFAFSYLSSTILSPDSSHIDIDLLLLNILNVYQNIVRCNIKNKKTMVANPLQ